MSQALAAILLGTWVPPEGKETIRRHSCIKGVDKNKALHEHDSYIELQVTILRFMRDFPKRWFSPSEIHMNIETKFSMSGMGVVLKDMAKEEFLLVQFKTKNRRAVMYKFNGVEK